MCWILFLIHLVPLVHEKVFVCKNFGKNSAKYAQRRQVDVAGGLGPTLPRRLVPPRCCPMPPVPLPRHWCMGEDLQGFSTVDPTLICFKGRDGAALVLWVHRHKLGGLQPTSNRPPARTTALPTMQNHWGVNPRCWKPSTSLGCLQVPLPYLHTIKGGVELVGEVRHLFPSIPSSLA
jgi:hypothetical protein